MANAKWKWNLTAEKTPGAVEIVDLLHVKEHVIDVIKTVLSVTKKPQEAKEKLFVLLEN